MDILIIEDEQAAARRLEKQILAIHTDANIIGKLDSIETSLDWLSSHPMPDLILLDIHLADGASFEIFKHTEITCPIIFTTAYDQYAIQAFRVNAVDYLLKPIKPEELAGALDKVNSRQASHFQAMDYKKLSQALRVDAYSRRFLVKIGQSIKVIDVGEAAYFYTEDKITFVVIKEGKRYPVDYSLEKLEDMLDPRLFFRINRQIIVGLDAIKEMYAYSKSRVKIVLEPDAEFNAIVSTERSPNFKKWLIGEE
jgi:two-component system LytT family response regulator